MGRIGSLAPLVSGKYSESQSITCRQFPGLGVMTVPQLGLLICWVWFHSNLFFSGCSFHLCKCLSCTIKKGSSLHMEISQRLFPLYRNQGPCELNPIRLSEKFVLDTWLWAGAGTLKPHSWFFSTGTSGLLGWSVRLLCADALRSLGLACLQLSGSQAPS